MISFEGYEINEVEFGGELFYEIYTDGKMQYAIQYKMNSAGNERWLITGETFREDIQQAEVEKLGAFIESHNL